MHKVLLILVLFFPCLGLAQQEQSIWMLGQNVGLDFNKSPVSLVSGSRLTAKGGGSTISDELGNLLFYTDGVQVWNKNHQLMTNGTGLKGNPDVNQSVIILPRPLHRYRYFIFTTNSRQLNSPNALWYSEVDMTLENGLGAVISKNTKLLENVAEKITATLQDDCQNFWLLTHKWDSKDFCAFPINKNGVSSSPVISTTGSTYKGELKTGMGSFKLSGHSFSGWVVSTLPDIGLFEIFDFKTTTGKIGTMRNHELSADYKKAGFATFSHQQDRLFTTSVSGEEIYEFRLGFPFVATQTAILNSARLISKESGAANLIVGSTKEVYIQKKNSTYLGVLEYNWNSSNWDIPVKYKPDGLNLKVNQPIQGLPNTISHYLHWKPGGINLRTSNCLSGNIQFKVDIATSIDSVVWNFGDPRSGSRNTSKVLSPFHLFTKSQLEWYPISVTVFAKGHKETVKSNFPPYPAYKAINDTSLCFNKGSSYTFTPKVYNIKSYLWQDGSTGQSITVTKPGIYWYEMGDLHFTQCSIRDSFEVKALPKPMVKLGNDTTICSGKTLLLKAGNPSSTYKWQDGSAQSTFLVSKPGFYKVTVTNKFGCTTSDSIKVHYLTPPAINLGIDTTICAGTEFVLNGKLPGVSYKWQDGSTASTFKVTKAGTYWVDATIDICTARDSIVIKTRKACLGDLFVPNIITPNGDGINDTFVILDPDKSAVWQLTIYNRLGKQVFQTAAYDNKWNAPGLGTGIYYYHFRDAGNRSLKGYIEVVR